MYPDLPDTLYLLNRAVGDPSNSSRNSVAGAVAKLRIKLRIEGGGSAKDPPFFPGPVINHRGNENENSPGGNKSKLKRARQVV